MKILERAKKLLGIGQQPRQKSWWTSYGGSGFAGSYDAFGGQPTPSKADLIKAYDDLAYICVSLISRNIAHIPIRLYVKTATGQRQPKCATAPVMTKNLDRIISKAWGTDIKEVIEHPLLDLISRCNAYHNKHDLIEHTEADLDLTGDSYWLMNFNTFGVPEELYLLPSYLMRPERDENHFIKKWIFGQGMNEKTYRLEEIVHFKVMDPSDPYGLGKSPLQGIWGRRQISSKELSFLDNYLSNQGKPDAILGIKDSISPLEAERIAKEYHHRFQGQGSGGLFVVDGTTNLQPISWPAKDLAELELYQTLKTTICNAYHIPPDIFESGASSNRSTREAALYSLAAQCLQPRIDGIVQKINDRLIPYFDDRLFFEADNIVPADKDYELSVQQMLLTQQVVTRDEVRIRHGYVSEEWAREPLLPSGVMPATTFSQGVELPEAEPELQPVDRTAQAQAIQALQQAVYAGQLPRSAGLAQLQIIYGFTAQEAEALLPDAPPTPPAGPPGPSGGQSQDNGQSEDKQPQEDSTKVVTASPRRKAMRQLAPGPMINALRKFFKQLEGSVLTRLKAMEDIQTKTMTVVDWFDPSAWTEKMTDEMKPVLEAYYDHGAKETMGMLNLSSSLFNTVQPKLKEGVNKASLILCQETIETTRMELTQAQELLKKEISEGLEVGDVKNEMTKRVQKVFQEAEEFRAFRIGATEASRGQHSAMQITATESGVVKGKTWLLSSDACPLCLPLSNKTVGLEDNFEVEGTGPYAEIPYPPRHPSCRCSLLLETGKD